ncbi:MAG: redox-regulated ATPase YchF [Firmicutes bacterium]|nr:redox-regulated ATPase YchF [Bacillota bacterium]
MNIPLIGLPASGKSSLFALLARSRSGNGKSNGTGVARVPDPRVDFLSGMYSPGKTTHAQVCLQDNPGYSAAAAASLARKADAVVLMVGAFAAAAGDGQVVREFDSLLSDLVIADLAQVESTLERMRNPRGGPHRDNEIAALAQVQGVLESGLPASLANLSPEDRTLLGGYGLATWRPIVVAVNLSEEQLGQAGYPGKAELARRCRESGGQMVEFGCLVENEIASLPPEDQQSFLSEYGLQEPGIHRLARAVYESMGLVSFFTVGEDEVRAWPLRRGSNARQAAGKIHSDIERGFIRAEIFSFDDLVRLGSARAVKESGRLRLESRDYIIQDGDICSFRFNV